jgi:hypothetical protein
MQLFSITDLKDVSMTICQRNKDKFEEANGWDGSPNALRGIWLSVAVQL